MAKMFVLLVAFAALASIPRPASAQGLRYYFCYAVDSQNGKILVSGVQNIGPVAERASYPERFRAWLAAKGLASPKSTPYCVMQGSAADIVRGMEQLPQQCNECLSIDHFEQVPWGQGSKAVAARLAAANGSRGEPAANSKLANPSLNAIYGLWLMVRLDQPDMISSGNSTPDASLLQARADLRGGKWQTLLSDDRCPGWGAVAYASDGAQFVYFVQRGRNDEEAASQAALARAAKFTALKRGWRTQLLESYNNLYAPPDVNLDTGEHRSFMDKTKAGIKSWATNECAEKPDRGVGGARG